MSEKLSEQIAAVNDGSDVEFILATEHLTDWEQQAAALEAENARLREACRYEMAAISSLLDYRQHRSECSYEHTEFCDCGLREAADDARSAYRLAVEALGPAPAQGGK